MTAPSPVVELRGVSKRFGGTQALDTVDLELHPAEVHAFVGENGAGKSTLGKIIAGLYAVDAGELLADGQPAGRWDPIHAQRAGIAMIAQELSLVPQLTVAQNVFLGIESSVGGVLRRDLRRRFLALSEQAGFDLDPDVPVGELRIAQQQKVEILRALARDARVIVMDEPTSSLTAHETAQLHDLIRGLREQGRTVVYVSHFLDAVLEVSDRITILRDGVKVRTAPVAQETKQTMVAGMLGRELSVTFPPRPASTPNETPPLLELDMVSTASGISDVSLIVKPGEIVGLLGLVGSGRSEIAHAIAGADRITAGSLRLEGREPADWSVRRAIDAGIVMVPESRHDQGLILQRSVRENISLAFLDRVSRFGVISRRRERSRAQELADALEMRPRRVELEIAGLSGGNQQKALLGKWLLGEPRLVILDEPTRGVDIGAKATIYHLIADLAARGVAVVLISSEHEEVLNLATRAYTVIDGTVRDEVDPSRLEVSDLLTQLFETDTKPGALA
ncbi:sugar ABC transporter ATP-binding protein [Microbacterium paludicola]|uniref:Sugar ABC transporter ATP-binding protein n=1 Tax=Microbacterium paludicola TaxID=300019 RepID=A0A4Y9FT15_9MICO|nr:sugar ABC transporter ATP-binding protein [Microbacterium paludicola]MBF0817286.1 sugar ABC transporter ATP-binding protein [Microbacterium paludicola]TFU31992.1 sugar ABC transporter ATP-binding protein [Microbacterium paludicola]